MGFNSAFKGLTRQATYV